MNSISVKTIDISIIGLGYVGLPLAIEFSKLYNVVAFDINKKRINELKNKIDRTGEISKNQFNKSKKIIFSNNPKDISKSNYYIITVPTPIKNNHKPDLSYLINACKIVASYLKKNDIIIIESTVYPGVTEEICAKILENHSKLIFNKDFYCGYSPERINPGDSKYKLVNIKKITSGSNKLTANIVDKLYSKIIKAGTFKVSSIKIAEAAKVIENCQRDINVAFVNELSLIFDKLNINTQEVLKAASTKWNFLNFTPGLVGGHCIGIDPYYLTYNANKAGYKSKIILAGRKLNSKMGTFVANKLIKNMKLNKIKVENSKILIMGFSFKENCKDIRNTGVIDIVNHLKNKRCLVDIYDPIVNKIDGIKEYNLKLIKKPKYNNYDSIIIAVAHKIFKNKGINYLKKFGKKNCLIFDVKSLFHKNHSDISL